MREIYHPALTKTSGAVRHVKTNTIPRVTTGVNSIFKKARADLMRVKAKTKQKAANARKRKLMRALQLAQLTQGLATAGRKGRQRMSKQQKKMMMALQKGQGFPIGKILKSALHLVPLLGAFF